MNEETKLENQAENIVVESEAGDDADEQFAEETAESNRTSWKQVVMGGVSGIALGAAGILLTGAKIPGGSNDENGGGDITQGGGGSYTTPSNLASGVENASGISVATGVNDDMSFSEAFAAARHEVGANGAFMWHGQVYSTCYAEEWNALSPEDQNAFSENALAAVNSQPAPVHDDVTTDPGKPLVAENHEPQTDDDTIEVHVLGVEENVMTDDGEIINVGVAEVEGHSALFIDGDADGTFDLLAVDVDDDGYIDVDNEVFDVEDPDMNVSAFSNETPVPSDPSVDDIYAQMPDYTNDADVSSLA